MLSIESIKKIRKINNFITDKNEVINNLQSLFEYTTTKVTEKVAIAFSGGVDSSSITFVLKKNNLPFTLYNVGFSNSKDYISANETAKKEGWELVDICLDNLDIEELAKEVISLTGKHDPITVGVGIVTLLVAKNAKEEVIVTGLGSEDIFAGYERHKRNIHEECLKGLENIWERDIQRDKTICEHFGKKVFLPFLKEEFVIYAMQISPELKVGEFKKQIFREAMKKFGLPEYIAFRKKSAAQYGSKVDHAIEKLAKNNGLKKSEYLASLCTT